MDRATLLHAKSIDHITLPTEHNYQEKALVGSKLLPGLRNVGY